MAEPTPPRPTFTLPPKQERPDLEERDPFEITNPGMPVFPPYVKGKLDLFARQVEASLEKHDNKLTVRSVIVAVGAVAAGVIACILFIDNRVAAQTDAGIKGVVEQVKGQDARLNTVEKRVDRIDDKLDLLLDAARVPQWKRPPPLDGGSP